MCLASGGRNVAFWLVEPKLPWLSQKKEIPPNHSFPLQILHLGLDLAPSHFGTYPQHPQFVHACWVAAAGATSMGGAVEALHWPESTVAFIVPFRWYQVIHVLWSHLCTGRDCVCPKLDQVRSPPSFKSWPISIMSIPFNRYQLCACIIYSVSWYIILDIIRYY